MAYAECIHPRACNRCGRPAGMGSCIRAPARFAPTAATIAFMSGWRRAAADRRSATGAASVQEAACSSTSIRKKLGRRSAALRSALPSTLRASSLGPSISPTIARFTRQSRCGRIPGCSIPPTLPPIDPRGASGLWVHTGRHKRADPRRGPRSDRRACGGTCDRGHGHLGPRASAWCRQGP